MTVVFGFLSNVAGSIRTLIFSTIISTLCAFGLNNKPLI